MCVSSVSTILFANTVFMANVIYGKKVRHQGFTKMIDNFDIAYCFSINRFFKIESSRFKQKIRWNKILITRSAQHWMSTGAAPPFIADKHVNNAMSSTLKKINCIQQIRLWVRIGVMVNKISLIEKHHSALKASASTALVSRAGSQH